MEKQKEKEREKEEKIRRFKTARGRTTRYSCLFSTVPSKRRSPPRV